jgi:hypothetical protein
MKMSKNKNLDDLISKLEFIDVYIHATHLSYINDNNVLYTVDAAVNGSNSWLTPYNKPQLLYHDKHKDAVGRVISYSVEDTAVIKGEPSDYVKLKVRLTDSDAISKVIKGIYYTCSVGSSTSKIRCSICDQVLTVDGLCEHEKGTMFEGKRVYWIVDNISYTENSFVNNPADSYSKIVSIDFGTGDIEYEQFLSDKEQIITKFIMEDEMNKKTERTNLPTSAFCGPNRTFPAIDAKHVTTGITLVDSATNLSDDTKLKIKSALYRKGKRWDIEPQEDELKTNPDMLVFRMDDEFSEAEVNAINDFFKENPEADIVDATDSGNTGDSKVINYTISDYDEIKKSKKDEIIAFTDFLMSEYKKLESEIITLKESEKTLKDSVSEKDTILTCKEDEINKLLDENASVRVSYKKAIIDNIIDLKYNVNNKDDEVKKYESRKVDSLIDSLNDTRIELSNKIVKVEDITLTDSRDSVKVQKTSGQTIEPDNSQKSRIDRFFRKPNKMEEING